MQKERLSILKNNLKLCKQQADTNINATTKEPLVDDTTKLFIAFILSLVTTAGLAALYILIKEKLGANK